MACEALSRAALSAVAEADASADDCIELDKAQMQAEGCDLAAWAF